MFYVFSDGYRSVCALGLVNFREKMRELRLTHNFRVYLGIFLMKRVHFANLRESAKMPVTKDKLTALDSGSAINLLRISGEALECCMDQSVFSN